MSIRIESYKVADRNYLVELFEKSFKNFKDCCNECWCCQRRKKILKEFHCKGFNTFNLKIKFWKLNNEDLNKFLIFPLVEKWHNLKP